MDIHQPRRHPSRDWSDKESAFTDALDQRVQAILTRLDPDTRTVMQVQGRREFERLADDRQRRIDARESSHEISEAMPVRDAWRGIGQPRSRAQEITAANRARDGDWPGREHMTDDEVAEWQHDAYPDLDELLPEQRTTDDAPEDVR